jgi:lysozyme
MTDVDQDTQRWIKKNEGLKLESYMDTTGHLTVGWGRNLVNGIRLDEAELMFQNDLKRTVTELEHQPWYINQPQNVKNALINMNFNLGISRLLDFRGMINALIAKNYTLAAQEALESLWAKQVGDRARQIALMIRQAL